jgi:hypothetical protein
METESDLDLAMPDAPPAGGFGVFAAVAASITGNDQTRMDAAIDRRRQLAQRMHQVPVGAIQVPLALGAGVFQMADLLSPKAGFMWSVRRLTGSLFSAGSVQVFKNGFTSGGAATGGELVVTFAAAGTQTFGRGEILLDQNDQLIIVATGITGSVQIQGAADCFERWLLPEYLM